MPALSAISPGKKSTPNFFEHFSTNQYSSPGAMLISGAGLYHRGGRGSGGFIAPKLITYDFSKHVKAEPPPTEFAEETTDFMPVVN